MYTSLVGLPVSQQRKNSGSCFECADAPALVTVHARSSLHSSCSNGGHASYQLVAVCRHHAPAMLIGTRPTFRPGGLLGLLGHAAVYMLTYVPTYTFMAYMIPVPKMNCHPYTEHDIVSSLHVMDVLQVPMCTVREAAVHDVLQNRGMLCRSSV